MVKSFLRILSAFVLIIGLPAMAQENQFVLQSTSFTDGQMLPLAQVYNEGLCKDLGKNLSPELQWSGEPEATKSFAIIVHDPDAPYEGGWYHWLLLNIPADVHRLAEGRTIRENMLETKNSFGFYNYGGACPPSGTHRYNFTIYALDEEKLDISPETLPQDVEAFVQKHSLGRANLQGLYGLGN